MNYYLNRIYFGKGIRRGSGGAGYFGRRPST